MNPEILIKVLGAVIGIAGFALAINSLISIYYLVQGRKVLMAARRKAYESEI